MKLFKVLLLAFFGLTGALHEVNAQCGSIPADIDLLASTNVTCNGLNNGTITVDLDNATTLQEPYNFQLFDQGSGLPFLSATEFEDKPNRSVVYSDVPPGIYEVRLIKVGCGALSVRAIVPVPPGYFEITEPDVLAITVNSTDPDCDATPGVGDGSINLTIAGGSIPYNVSWVTTGTPIAPSNPNANPTNIVVNSLDAASYTINVTDANGCVASQVINIAVTTTAAAGPDQNVCADNAVLAANAAGPGEIGTWTVIAGTGTFTNANSPTTTVTGLSLGANTFQWRITDVGGLCTGSTDQVTITRDTPPTANAGADQIICEGSTVTLAGSIGGSATSLTWTTSGDGSFNNATLPGAVYTPGPNDITAGTVNLTLTTDDPANSCPAAADVMTVTINDAAEVDAGPDQTVCETSIVNLAGTSGGSTTTVTWTTSGDGSFSNANSLTSTYTPGANDRATNTVTLTLTSNDPAGPCPSDVDQVTLTLDDAPTANAGVDQIICEGSTVTLAGVIGGTATSLTWTTSGDGTFNNATLPGAVYTPGPNDITAGTVNLTLTTNDPPNTCLPVADVMTVTINDAPEVDAGPDQIVCETSPITLAGTSGGGTTTVTWTTSGDGAFSNANSLTSNYTPGVNDLIANTVTLTLTSNDPAGPCVADVDQMTITLQDAPTADAGANQIICEGSTVTLSGVIGGTASSLTWTTSGDGTFNNANLPGAIYTPGPNDITSGTVTLTITTDDPANNCNATSDFMTVTINDAAEVDAGPDQTVCETSIITLAGTSAGSTSTITWTTSGNGSFSNPNSLTSTYTPGPADIIANSVTLTITSNDPAGPCPADIDQMIITLQDAPTADAGANQIICEGSTVTLAGSIGGTATSLTWTTSGDGTFNNAALPNAVYTPGPNDLTAGTVNLTITTDDPANNCTAVADVMTVTINDAAEVDAGPDQTVCETSVITLAGTSGGSTTTVTWTTAGDGVFSNANSLTSTYTPGVNDRIANSVTLTLTSNDPAGPCAADVDQMTITLQDAPTADAGANQIICEGSTVSLSGTIGGTATSLTWTTSGDGTFNNAALPNAVYTPGPNDLVAATVNLTITTDDPANNCTAVADVMTVTINDAAEVDAGPDQIVCETSIITLAGTSGGSTTTVTWTTAGDGSFSNPNSLTATYTPGPGDIIANTVTLTLTSNDPAGPCPADIDQMTITLQDAPTTDAGPNQIICEGSTVTMAGSFAGTATSITWTTSGDGTFNDPTLVGAVYTPGPNDITAGTVNLTITTDDPANNCNAAVDLMTVTINDAAEVDAGPDQAVCETSIINLAGTSGGSTTTVTWTTSGDGVFSNANSLASTYTPGATDIATNSVTLTLTSNDPVGPCPADVDQMTITLDDPATADAGANQIICEGSTVTLAGIIGGSATTLTWTTSGDGTFDDATLAGAVYTPGANDINAGTVNLTLTTNDPANNCNAAVDVMTVTINDAADVDAGADQTICTGSVVTLAGTSGGSTTTITWTTAGDGAFSNVNSLTSTYTPGPNDIINNSVVLTLTSNDPAGPCPADVDQMTITIDDQATANAGADQIICEGSAVTLAGVIGGAATSLTWTTSGDGSFDDATLPGAIYTPGANDILAGTVNLTLTTNDPPGSCAAVSDVVTITINDAADVNAGPDQTVCESSVITLAGTSGGSTTTTAWTTSGDGTFSNAASLTSTYTPGPGDIGANTVTLTLTSNDPAGPCPADIDQMTITLEDAATANAGADQIICEGSTVTLSGLIGGAATSLTWTTSGDGTFDNVNLPGAVYTPGPNDLTAGTVNLTLTTDDPANSCNAAVDVMTVTINDAPSVDAGADQTVCETSVITLAGTMGGSTASITWTTSGDGTFSNANLLTSTYTPGAGDIAANTVTLTLTSDDPAGPCVADVDQMVITLEDAPTANAGADNTICEGNTATLAGVIGGTATTLTWSTAGDGTFDNAAIAGAQYTPGPNDILAGSVNLTLTTDDPANNCNAASDVVTITINPAAQVSAGANQTVCEAANVSLSGTMGGSASSITWTTSGDGSFDDVTSLTAVYTPGANDINAGSVTLTITTDDPAGTCTSATDNMVVTINRLPVASISGSTTNCSGQNAVLTFTLSAGTYNIVYTDGSSNFNLNNVSSGATVNVAPVVNTTYTIVSVTNTVTNCTVTAPNAKITGSAIINVLGLPDASFTGLASAYCVTDGASVLTPATPGGSFVGPGLTGNSFNPAAAGPGNHTISYVVFSGGCLNASNVAVTVHPIPAMVANQTKAICAGTNTSYRIELSPTNTPAGTVFNWPDPDGAGPASAGVNVALGASGVTHINDVLTNATTAPITVTYVVTPSIGACTGATQNVVITVNPVPSISAEAKTICSGENVGDVVFSASSLPVGTTFSWPDPDGAGPATSASNIGFTGSTIQINNVLTNATAAPIQVTYVVTPTFGSCIGAAQNITVTVNPGAIVTAGADKFTCPDGTINLTGASIGGVATTGTWSLISSPPGGDGVISNTGALANPGTVTFTASVSGDYVLRLTTDEPAGACTANQDDVVLTILDEDDPLCTGGNGGGGGGNINCTVFTVNVVETRPTCGGQDDGELRFTVTGGSPSPNYVLTLYDSVATPIFTKAVVIAPNTAYTFDELSASTNYFYQVDDGTNVCRLPYSLPLQTTVDATLDLASVTNPTCFGSATGSVVINATGSGTGQYFYSIDNLSWKPFVPGTPGQIADLPPLGTYNILVGESAGDVCHTSVEVTINSINPDINATFSITPASCAGADGAVTNIIASGGSGSGYQFSIDGINYKTDNNFTGLSGGFYSIRVRDGAGCEKIIPANVTFPGFINFSYTVIDPTCANNGNSGAIVVKVLDPGTFRLAVSQDQFNEPADADYRNYSDPFITFDNLARGTYFIYARTNSAVCPTRSEPIAMQGAYALSFEVQPTCVANDLSLTLTNITGEPGAPFEIRVYRKSTGVLVETIQRSAISATATEFLEYQQHTFLRNADDYTLQLVQTNSATNCMITSPMVDVVIPNEVFALIGPREQSYPDIANGSLEVTNISGGTTPYQVRIELDSAASFNFPQYETNFTEPDLNANNQFGKKFDNIPPGRYVVQVTDEVGCVLELTARVKMDQTVYIPNIFTPNGDNVNDLFFIRNLPADNAKLIVTSRWGKEVYSSTNYQNNWTGEGAADGVYFYQLSIGGESPITGWVEIIRGQKP